MRKTFAVAGVLCCVSLSIACDEDKKAETPPAESAVASTPPAPPPPPPKPAPAEAIARTMSSVLGLWNGHDAAKIAATYEPKGKLVIPGEPEFVGTDAIAGEAKQTFATYSDFKLAITRSYTKGNTVVLEWVITGKNDGPAMGKPASGRQMGVDGASVITFDDDGLIKEDHRYVDVPTILSQLDPKAKAGTFRAPVTLPTGATEAKVSKGGPEEQKVLDAGKAFYAAFEGNKMNDFGPVLSDDSVFDDYTTPATVKGAKAITAMAAQFRKILPDMAQTKPLQFAAGDTLITEGTLTGTQKGAMGPIKASNKPVSLRFVDIGQFKDGKVARFATYADSAEMLVEIGAMPPLGAPPAGSASAAPAASGAAPMGSAMAASSAKPR